MEVTWIPPSPILVYNDKGDFVMSANILYIFATKNGSEIVLKDEHRVVSTYSPDALTTRLFALGEDM